ncbi:hypothetical protein BHM03_00007838 [Ensete ventricosum]|nr:hypothetical protein BHM03_00007838 [Ensete ventricosum]
MVACCRARAKLLDRQRRSIWWGHPRGISMRMLDRRPFQMLTSLCGSVRLTASDIFIWVYHFKTFHPARPYPEPFGIDAHRIEGRLLTPLRKHGVTGIFVATVLSLPHTPIAATCSGEASPESLYSVDTRIRCACQYHSVKEGRWGALHLHLLLPPSTPLSSAAQHYVRLSTTTVVKPVAAPSSEAESATGAVAQWAPGRAQRY